MVEYLVEIVLLVLLIIIHPSIVTRVSVLTKHARVRHRGWTRPYTLKASMLRPKDAWRVEEDRDLTRVDHLPDRSHTLKSINSMLRPKETLTRPRRPRFYAG